MPEAHDSHQARTVSRSHLLEPELVTVRPDHAGLTIRPFVPDDEAGVVALWEAAGLTRPWNDPRKDIERKLRVQPEWFLVATAGAEIIGSVMAGYDGHRGWVNYLAVTPASRRAGVGRALMAEVERVLGDVGCPKINLQIRSTNLVAVGFYEALGYMTDDVISLGRRLEHDSPGTSRPGEADRCRGDRRRERVEG